MKKMTESNYKSYDHLVEEVFEKAKQHIDGYRKRQEEEFERRWAARYIIPVRYIYTANIDYVFLIILEFYPVCYLLLYSYSFGQIFAHLHI